MSRLTNHSSRRLRRGLTQALGRLLTITAKNMRWIRGVADDPQDQCAHGEMTISAEGVDFVTASDGEITVSGAALFLLRTLDLPHTPDNSVAPDNVLLPCCAFSPWPIGENGALLIMGCGGGVDLSVEHISCDLVRVGRGELNATVTLRDWRSAVVDFAQQIETFYATSGPKAEPDDNLDRKGWEMFWSEWRDRMGHHASAA